MTIPVRGRCQAVRLPKEYRFADTEVMVKHFGNGVLLLVINNTREFAKVPGLQLDNLVHQLLFRPPLLQDLQNVRQQTITQSI